MPQDNEQSPEQRLEQFNEIVTRFAKKFKLGCFVFAIPEGQLTVETKSSCNIENMDGDKLLHMIAKTRGVEGVHEAIEKESGLFLAHCREERRKMQINGAIKGASIPTKN